MVTNPTNPNTLIQPADLNSDCESLLDHRVTVAMLVEDLLGGVLSWGLRIKKVFHDDPHFNLIAIECPVYAKQVSGRFDVCAPTKEDLYEALKRLKPAIVIPNYTWEAFNVCARLIEEGHEIRCLGFCRTDEELFYKPLQWFEPLWAHCVAVSPECANVLVERMPHREKDISILPTGVFVPEHLQRTYQTAPIRLAYGGRLSQAQKCVWDFVPLANHLAALNVDFVFNIYGKGSQEAELRQAFSDSEHGDRVVFHGEKTPDEMYEIWEEHDVLILTSEYEGTSNSIIEAIARGTVPVVTAASSGIEAVVRDGENGFVVPVGDMKRMAKRIQELAATPDRLSAMGAQAYAKSKEFSMDRYRDRFTTILQKTLDAPLRSHAPAAELTDEIAGMIRKISHRSPEESRRRAIATGQLNDHRTPSADTKRALPDPIVLVAAADDNFSMPLAVMVRSVLEHLSPSRKIALYVIDGGISKESKRKLHQSWEDDRLTIHWLPLDPKQLKNLKTRGHINAMAYARILAPGLLPKEISKAIYLDGDMLVQHDLGELWDTDIGDHHLLAVQDMTIPYVDSQLALENFGVCSEYLSSPCIIPQYAQFDMSPYEKYLNSGLLVFNLVSWRRDDTADAVLSWISENPEKVVWLDQDGLNVVLHDKWASLDERWNQIPHIYRYPSSSASPFSESVYRRIVDEPWIIHFSTRIKPWNASCDHPLLEEFFRTMDKTAWAGWRPEVPKNLLQNPGWDLGDDNAPNAWLKPLGGVFEILDNEEGNEKRLQVSLSSPDENAILIQYGSYSGPVSRRKLVASVRAKCDEPDRLGLNISTTVDGERVVHSTNHIGNGQWQTLTVECPLSKDIDREKLEFLLVLRSPFEGTIEVSGPQLSVVAGEMQDIQMIPTSLTWAKSLVPATWRRKLKRAVVSVFDRDSRGARHT